MFSNKHILILLLLIVGICAISSVSAADDASDVVAADDAQLDEVATVIEEEVAAADKEDAVAAQEEEIITADGDEKLSASEDTQIVSKDESAEPVSYIHSSLYSIKFEEEYLIQANQKGQIKFHLTPVPSYMSTEAYHFYFIVFDVNYNKLYQKEIEGTNHAERDVAHTIPANSLLPGSYVVAAINYDDSNPMAAAVLRVGGTAVITSNDFKAQYMSGAKMTARVTDAATGKPLSALSVRVVFSNGKTSVTKTYTPNSDGVISFEPPVGVGTWSVSFYPNEGHISGAAAKTATITKSAVKIKAYKITEYKGFKTKLKALVTSHGKKVKEGTVTFKINGKSYKAKVKNGVATKKINLKKLKTYKYTAKYNGNKNLKASKKVKGKATLKKRQKVKISFKKPVVYMGQTKKVVVKIKSKGKYVKSGLLYVKHKNGVDKVKVKTGKVVLYATGLVSDHYKGSNGISTYYKKTVTKKFWMKYVPTAHKYKGTKIKYKATSKYKCPTCGRTGSHNHYSYGYFVRYTYPIVVS